MYMERDRWICIYIERERGREREREIEIHYSTCVGTIILLLNLVLFAETWRPMAVWVSVVCVRRMDSAQLLPWDWPVGIRRILTWWGVDRDPHREGRVSNAWGLHGTKAVAPEG